MIATVRNDRPHNKCRRHKMMLDSVCHYHHEIPRRNLVATITIGSLPQHYDLI